MATFEDLLDYVVSSAEAAGPPKLPAPFIPNNTKYTIRAGKAGDPVAEQLAEQHRAKVRENEQKVMADPELGDKRRAGRVRLRSGRTTGNCRMRLAKRLGSSAWIA